MERLYIVDSGLEVQPWEISGFPLIYGVGTKQITLDESLPSEGGVGTCTAQKTGGVLRGGRQGQIVIVKINLDAGSMFSGLMDVIKDLKLQIGERIIIRGWTVTNLRLKFAPKGGDAKYEAGSASIWK